jgi:hypothetical protein
MKAAATKVRAPQLFDARPETRNPAEVEDSTGSTPRGVTGDGPVDATYAGPTAQGSADARLHNSRTVTYVALDSGLVIRKLHPKGQTAPVEYPRVCGGDDRAPRVLVHDETASESENLRLAEHALELMVLTDKATFVPMVIARAVAQDVVARRTAGRLRTSQYAAAEDVTAMLMGAG